MIKLSWRLRIDESTKEGDGGNTVSYSDTIGIPCNCWGTYISSCVKIEDCNGTRNSIGGNESYIKQYHFPLDLLGKIILFMCEPATIWLKTTYAMKTWKAYFQWGEISNQLSWNLWATAVKISSSESPSLCLHVFPFKCGPCIMKKYCHCCHSGNKAQDLRDVKGDSWRNTRIETKRNETMHRIQG